MKVFALPANEDWICDRFVREWNEHSKVSVPDPWKADVVWLLSDWCWQQVPTDLLKTKIVVASVHHIVPDKFSPAAIADFATRDQFVHAYHVPCEKTRQQVLTVLNHIGVQKPIFSQPFWVNQNLWKPVDSDTQVATRVALGFASTDIVIGSFQRDTEGHDLKSPKLEKGPDLFCDAVISIHREDKNVCVLLAGWRRQYVISRLQEAGVKYVYEERPSIERIRELYGCLDMYVCASRYEGGPQSILECAAMRVPIVSRDVGVASEILHPKSVNDDVLDGVFQFSDDRTEHAYREVSKLFLPHGMEKFVQFFESLERRSEFSKHSPGVGARKTDV